MVQPNQSGDHNTFICNGVDPRAMKRLNDDLDRMDLNLQQKTVEANEWARKYNELNAQFEETKKQLAAKGEDPILVQTAQDLLHQGKLDEARKIYDRLIASDEGNVDRAAQDYFDRACIFQLQFRMAEAMADYGRLFSIGRTTRAMPMATVVCLSGTGLHKGREGVGKLPCSLIARSPTTTPAPTSPMSPIR